jgi:hypothetical protein
MKSLRQTVCEIWRPLSLIPPVKLMFVVGDLRFVQHDLGTLPKRLGSLTTPQSGTVSLTVRDGICVPHMFICILMLSTTL